MRHPVDRTLKLFFMADGEHVMKTIRNNIHSSRHFSDGGGRRIVVPMRPVNSGVAQASQPMNVMWQHLEQTYYHRLKYATFSICPGLDKESVFPDSWSAMSVPLARRVLSHEEQSCRHVLVPRGVQSSGAGSRSRLPSTVWLEQQ